MEYSGAWGKLIHEKNQKQKSRDTVPLRDGTLLPSSFRYTVVYVEYICKYRASASLRRGSDSLAKLEIYLRTQWFVKIEKEICEQFEDILKT
jgi:hypothetical protein